MKKSNLRWAYKTFILSISLSIVFSVLSQSLFPNLSIFWSVFIIVFFITIAVIFDMIGIAVASLDEKMLQKFEEHSGYKTAMTLCKNTEKVSSFCGDMVGDICGILSGAGGVSLVLNMRIYEPSVYFIVTCLVSSLIAGLTIFGKAVMKGYAVEHCDVVVMKTGQILETSPLKWLKRRKGKSKKQANQTKNQGKQTEIKQNKQKKY